MESGERRATLQLLFVIKNHSASKLIIKRNLALPLALSVRLCVFFFLIVSVSNFLSLSIFEAKNLIYPYLRVLLTGISIYHRWLWLRLWLSAWVPIFIAKLPALATLLAAGNLIMPYTTVPYVCKSKLKCNKTQTSARRRVRAVKGSTSLITGLCTRVARAVCYANIWHVSIQFGQLN